MPAAWLKWTAAGVWKPRPEWRCWWLYHWKKRWQNARPSSMEPNRPGNSGRYLSVLNCASEYGLSLEQCGRERLRRQVRTAGRVNEMSRSGVRELHDAVLFR